MRASQVAICALFISGAAFCQEYRATISGAVTDPSGSAVPKAAIVATETRTNSKTKSISDSQGQYTIPFLAPGEYSLTAEAPGFKQSLRQQIKLGPGDHPIVDVSLEIGRVSQTVEVSAEAPLVNSENASVGQTVTTREVEDLPLNGRTPLILAQLSLGVLNTSQPSLVHPFDSATPADISLAGTASQSSELLIDGAPDETWDMRLAYSPPQDAVQEVQVKAFDTDAAYGHTSGGALDQILKSGTNGLHGSAWEFNQPNTLNANTFFNNKSGIATPVTHFNQYGVTAGGPVMMPKFNGRNKLFWFFAWEGIKDSQPNSTLLTVPTDAEKQGDFSALLSGGSQFQLYDPYSAVQSGSTVKRTALPGNKIPTSDLSAIAQAYLNFYPEPNTTPGANGTNNFLADAPTADDFNNELV
ncbi:MAG: carboxypeptidase-like regulatory domain-containing protein [Bryobacteraceae bacterium]